MLRFVLIVSFLLACPALADAAFVGRSTSTSGALQYAGFGDVGGGVGSGRYTLGTCVVASGATACTFSGTYIETIASDHAPGMAGSFTLRLDYNGTGPSPVTAQSIAPGSDVLQFAPGATYTFTLDVVTAAGEHFTGLYPAPVFAESISFSTFLESGNFVCTGLGPTQPCGVGQVGLVAGATIAGGVNPFDFTIPGDFSIGQPVEVVEYYNAALDHYFITHLAAEMSNLDAGRTPTRWTRTGYTFKAYPRATAGRSPVCRFYIPPGLGDSHFFGRGAVECDETARKFPALVLEDPLFMYVALPTNGTCPAATRPVYRVFSNRLDANHRYMTDATVRDQMVGRGWLAEGDGPDRVVMCSPL